MAPHDFDRFPELTNRQMRFYYLDSPHKQITQNIFAKIERVHDGDTVTLSWQERDFTFPLRIAKLASPELKEEGGKESQAWLEDKILGAEVEILINPRNRVEKWGRLLGEIVFQGMNIGKEMITMGFATTFKGRDKGGFEAELRRATIS